MPSSVPPNTTEIIVNIVYGTTAAVRGVATVYQGYRAYKIWHMHRQSPENRDIGIMEYSSFFVDILLMFHADVELGQRSLTISRRDFESTEANASSIRSGDEIHIVIDRDAPSATLARAEQSNT